MKLFDEAARLAPFGNAYPAILRRRDGITDFSQTQMAAKNYIFVNAKARIILPH